MIAHNLLEPILQLVIDTMPRDNALNSACLEYFETVRREIVRDFIVHLVTTCREKLESITYVDVFQGLIRRYEQMQEPATTQELDNSFTSVDSEGLARPVGVVNGGKWGQGLKELDAVEEAYFNGSDDEEEGLSNGAKTNGASPVRPLVNYPDDDDGDENEMDVLTTSTPSASPTASQAQDSPNRRSSSKSDPTTPPERISEKRRREEDEEDELLANLSSGGPKRRSSVPSIANLKLRRKSSMTSAKDSAPKKISISLPMKSGGEDSKDG
jgi:protein phosphatase-4 regulatory subunit 3